MLCQTDSPYHSREHRRCIRYDRGRTYCFTGGTLSCPATLYLARNHWRLRCADCRHARGSSIKTPPRPKHNRPVRRRRRYHCSNIGKGKPCCAAIGFSIMTSGALHWVARNRLQRCPIGKTFRHLAGMGQYGRSFICLPVGNIHVIVGINPPPSACLHKEQGS